MFLKHLSILRLSLLDKELNIYREERKFIFQKKNEIKVGFGEVKENFTRNLINFESKI